MHSRFAKIITFLFLAAAFHSGYAQETAVVKGKITDSRNKPLQAVSAAISGVAGGTSSDSVGNFTLEVPANQDLTISFSFIGFLTKTTSVNLKPGEIKIVNMQMNSSAIELNNVVVEDMEVKTENMTRIDARTLQVMPNPSGNIESVLKTLPGVSSSNELSSTYNVRGGNYDENLVYVNDVEIYRPFLIRNGQQEGLSFVNSDLVSSLQFSAGGFDARYGDKLSSVLDIKYLKPTNNGGNVSASLLGGSISFYRTNPKKNWRLVFGARQKSNQYILKSLDTRGDYRPSFTDVQTGLSHTINKKWEVEFLGNYARNKYKLVPTDRETEFGTINEALRLTIYFDGQEVDRFETMLGAFTATNTPNDKLTIKYIVSAFNTYETETFDILGAYRLDELERDIGKPKFGDVAFTRGAGAYLIHARNKLDATVASVEQKGTLKLKNNTFLWGLRLQHEWIKDQISEWTMIDSAGYSIPHNSDSAGYVDPTVQPDSPLELYESLSSNVSLDHSRFSGYLQNNFSFKENSRVTASLGIRGNYLEYTNQFTGGPRGTVYYKPRWKHSTVVRFSSGYYYQAPFYRELRDYYGNLVPNIQAQRSIHFVLGADYYFRLWHRPFKYAAEGYYKILNDLIPYKVDNVRIRYLGNNSSDGYAYGIDMRINGEFVKGVESWASISYLKTMENISGDYYANNYNSDGKLIIPGYTLNDSIVKSDTIHPGYIPRPADQRINFGLFFQDYLPRFPTFKMHITLLYGSGLPFGPPGTDRWKDVLRIPSYRRVDIGFSKQIFGGNSKWNPRGKVWNNFSSIWLSLEVYNLLQVNNTISYIWITDITSRTYAVPNYLTARMLNLRLNVKF